MTEAKPTAGQTTSISSAEQLDQLLRVASPGGWIALAAIGLILVSALAWGFWGRIPTKVDGAGIIIREGGVMDIVALGQGQLSETKVGSGDGVTKGQVVATIAQPELQSQIGGVSRQLRDLMEQQQRLKDAFAKQDQVRSRLHSQQVQAINASLKDLDSQIAWLQEKLKDQEILRAKGLITTQILMNTREQMAHARQNERSARGQLKDLESKDLQIQLQQEQQLFQMQSQVIETQGKLSLLNDQMQVRSQVVSDSNGRILEVKTRVGAEVTPGSPLFSLESLDKDMVITAYVPASQGKRINKGSRVEISPSTVKREDYGFALGEVMAVSEFPATTQGMMALLQNQELVNQFSQGGPPIIVYAQLIKDPETVSGYKWSSRKGPPTQIFSGTICSVQVVVEEQAPLRLVIPYFKGLLGL